MDLEREPEPTWMYREGESRLFQHPDDVPAGEGWVDSPVKVGKQQQAPTPPSEAPVEAPVEATEAPIPPRRRRGRPPKNRA